MNKQDNHLWEDTVSRYDKEMARRRKENPLPFIISGIIKIIIIGFIIFLFYIA